MKCGDMTHENYRRKKWSIRDNSIFAECNQLPHKDDTEFDGIYIVPARKGKFKVSVSLMCSEYIEPKVHDIEFEIV